MAIVYLSLGSNLGDKVGYIQQAVALLKGSSDINVVATSSFYETEPMDMTSKNWFVNASVQLTTELSPEELLALCQKTESMLGRKRNPESKEYSDRTIDIDILFYDNIIINEETLTIPHRLLQRRAFVLVPMLEIAQDFVHPLFNKSISELYEALENPEQVYLYGTRV